MKKIYLFTTITALLFSFSASAQEQSADEIEAAKSAQQTSQHVQSKSALHSLEITGNSKFTATSGCDSLLTSYVGGNGLGGAMFDVVALQPLTIQYFYNNLSIATSGFRIYYKTGTYAVAKTDSTQWTFVGSTQVNATATNAPTLIPIPVNLAMNTGDTLGFYLTRTGTGTVRYTNGTVVDSLFASDSALAFYQGIGLSFPFGGSFSPRVWNGTIKYCTGSVGISNTSPNEKQILGFYNAPSNQLELTVPNEIAKENFKAEFALFSMDGKKLKSAELSVGKNIISTTSFAKGVYFYSIQNAQGYLKKTKLLIY